MPRRTTRKGKLAGAFARRAQAIIADVVRYDIDTRQAVQLARENLEFYQRGGGGAFTAAELPAEQAKSARELRELVVRAEAGEVIRESGVAEKYDLAARTIVGLLEMPGAPDFLTTNIMILLDQVAAGTGVGLWQEIDNDLATGSYSVSRLARILADNSLPTLLLEPAKDLPALIAAVLQHPDTPTKIYKGLAEAINESFDDGSSRRVITDSAEFIRLVLGQQRKQRAAAGALKE